MPALTALNQQGVREDLSNVFYMADAKETPFTSMVKKGKKPIDPNLWEYGLKRRGERKRGGVPDGKDVDAFDSQNPKTFVQARSEVWRRNPMVGFIAAIRARNGGVAGVTDEMDDAIADQMEELKRDVETELLSNQDSRPDDGVNGTQTRGLGRWIWSGDVADTASGSGLALAAGDTSSATTYDELPVPVGYRTPSDQIFNGSVSAMTEAEFGDLIQAKWTNTGASSELRGFVTSAIKNRIGLLSKYEADVAGMTPNVQVTSGRVSGNTLFGPSIDVYKSDWGTFTLHPVSNDFMPSAYTGYFVDMKQVTIRPTEMMQPTKLPNLGGGEREMIQSILGLEAGDPRAHAKIDGTA